MNDCNKCQDSVVDTRAQRASRVLRLITATMCGTWLVGVVLWLTVRDRVPYFSALFYALPVPVLCATGLAAISGMKKCGVGRRLRVLTLIVLALQMTYWLSLSIRLRTDDDRTEGYDDAVRLVFWNVCRGYLGFDDVAQELSETDADIIAMVESTEEAAFPDFWTSRLPGYTGLRLGSGMMILCRGEVLSAEPGNVPSATDHVPICRYRTIRLRVRGCEVRVILMDVKSHVLMSRRPAFERLQELCDEQSAHPLIVAADFNTPVESAWIGLLRSRLRNAFEAAGEGYRETWPMPFPVLSLDQVWGNSHITWKKCWRDWSLNSDHRPVITEFTLGPNADKQSP